ncbi:hypothetical protein [Alloactinosynnema sp. L-07]|uniref:hypothetical protein n=1 Tax=Alloactinosynnema sp. L-07 TaxID=1653480 RepID=UPI0012FBF03C|nr:hypothetical protein [Alloactinosynnema sp. L-07]
MDLIRKLINRPRWLPNPDKTDLRGDRALPLLCLQQPPTDSYRGFLAALDDRLAKARPDKVPHVLIDVAGAGERAKSRWQTEGSDRVPLMPLLDEIHHALAANRFGAARIRRFRHYRLAAWLSASEVRPAGERDDRAVTALLRTWYGVAEPTLFPDAEPVLAESKALRLLTAVFVAWHRPLRFLLWSTGKWGGGREPRWFMRQPFMVPLHSTSFVGFAERITKPSNEREKPEQLKRLLVHAFLEDLRLAFRPRGLRPRRWRRTAYVTVLLDGVTDANGGWELLQLINDVRNESGEIDPLLVVSTVDRNVSTASGRQAPPVHAIESEYSRWRSALPARRQRMDGKARFLVVRLPEPGGPEPTAEDEKAAGNTSAIRPRQAPVLARRSVVLAMVLVLVGGPLATGGTWLANRWAHNCLPHVSSGIAVKWTGDECVGYSDDSAMVFSTESDRLNRAQTAIFTMNREAEKQFDQNPGRPYFSVVYFAALSANSGQETAEAISEELEGIWIRQKQWNTHPSREGTLLRVIIANGGDSMRKANTVTEDFLIPLFRDDPNVLGVIGMDRTVTETEQAIWKLGGEGIPVIATTLTGPHLPGLSATYFSLAPGNDQQAMLMREFTDSKQAKLTVYRPKPDPGDTYVATLLTAIEQAFAPTAVRVVEWENTDAPIDVTCGPDQVAFYAGREDGIATLLTAVGQKCRENRPSVVGDDAVSRFVAQPSLRQVNELNAIPLSYVSMGSRTVLAGSSCGTSSTPASTPEHTLNEFCKGYTGQLAAGGTKPSVPWPAERIGVAYDAVSLYQAAVARYRSRRGNSDALPQRPIPDRAVIAMELRELRAQTGVTGPINFHERRDGGGDRLAILHISDISDVASQVQCVFRCPL